MDIDFKTPVDNAKKPPFPRRAPNLGVRRGKGALCSEKGEQFFRTNHQYFFLCTTMNQQLDIWVNIYLMDGIRINFQANIFTESTKKYALAFVNANKSIRVISYLSICHLRGSKFKAISLASKTVQRTLCTPIFQATGKHSRHYLWRCTNFPSNIFWAHPNIPWHMPGYIC